LFSVLATNEPPTIVHRHARSGASYSYVFTREHSGVSEALHAVRFSPDLAFAVGAGGLLLSRRPDSAWRVEPSNTRWSLNAISTVMARTTVYVVGDGGTILVRDKDAWHREWSPTEQNLNAITETQSFTFAAGQHGALIARGPRGWVNVDSTVKDTLRALWDCSFNEHLAAGESRYREAVCAAGEHGRLLRCVVASDSVTCATQPSITANDLLATDARSYIVGLQGTIVRTMKSDPFEVVTEQAPTSVDLFTIATNRWGVLAKNATPIDDVLAAGAHGTIVVLGPTAPPSSLTLADTGDLFGIDGQELEYFLVGSGGLILHVVLTDAMVPTAKEI
jgi:hypothetical protein